MMCHYRRFVLCISRFWRLRRMRHWRRAGLLRKKFEWVDNKLAGTNYLTGDDFTVADAYLFTVSGWAKMVALDLSDLVHLQAFLARVAARPAVQAALKAEGLIPA